MGLVAEVGEGPSRGGRRPIVLEFQDDACVILGVEMGGAHVAVALTDLRGQVLAWETREHPVRTDPPGPAQLIAELCDDCLGAPGGRRPAPGGIGVAVPSPVDPAHPDRLSTVVLPAWEEQLGLDDLGEQLRRAPAGGQRRQPRRPGRALVGRWAATSTTSPTSRWPPASARGTSSAARSTAAPPASPARSATWPSTPTASPASAACAAAWSPWSAARALEARAAELAADYPAEHPGRTDIHRARHRGRRPGRRPAGPAGDPRGGRAPGHRRRRPAEPHEPGDGGPGRRPGPAGRAAARSPARDASRSRTLVSSVAAAEILASELGPAVGGRRRGHPGAEGRPRRLPPLPRRRSTPDRPRRSAP